MNRLRQFFAPARVLPAATPRMLAFVRIVVCGILLASAVWEDLASTVNLPAKMREPLGLLGVVEAVTGGAFAWLCRTAWALHAVQAGTVGALALALLGGGTRVTVPLGALLYLLMTGIIREYTHYFHTGLVPLYALGVLAFTGCGEAWSLDRWRARRAGRAVVPDDQPRLTDAWAVYAVWIVIAGHYDMAGLHKMRAGIDWFHPSNFKSILLVDALQPMHFRFDFKPLLLALPDWTFTALAVTAVAVEISMALVLTAPRLRWILALLMAGTHVGIWLLQRVLFFDLILIQLVILVPPRWFARDGAEQAARGWPRRWPRPVLALAAGLALIWLARLEWYPLSDMAMYTDVETSGTIRYPQVLAYLASGAVVEGRPEEAIGALKDTRYRRLLRRAKKDGQEHEAQEFFSACQRLLNLQRVPAERIVAFEVVWKRWDFGRDPADASFGKVNKRIRYELPESAGSESAITVRRE